MAAVDIGTLAGRIDLEDRLSAVLDRAGAGVERFEGQFNHATSSVAQNAAAFFTAEVALEAVKEAGDLAYDALHEMIVEGSKANDVATNFEHLSGSASSAASSLSILRAGTQDTVTDFDLMRRSNDNLAAGLKLTDAQMTTLSSGAFALAKKDGSDVTTALDKISEALVRGNARAVQSLTGRIDLSQAEQDYAAKLHITTGEMSAQEKLDVDRQTILAAVAAATGRLGEQQLSLNDKLQQSRVAFQNWREDLSIAVSTSPAVTSAFDKIHDALDNAFGGDMKDVVLDWINRGANAVGHYGPIVINGLSEMKTWLVDIYNTVTTTWNALPDWMKAVATNSILAAAGVYVLDRGVAGTVGTFAEFAGVAGNMTQTLTGLPTLIALAAGQMKLLAGLSALSFTSLADAAASLKLLGGAALSALGPIGVVAIALGAIVTAWQGANKDSGWIRTLSDDFEYASLRVQGYTEAEANAMIATDHLTQKQQEQSSQSKQQDQFSANLKKTMDDLRASINGVNLANDQNTDSGLRMVNGMRMNNDQFKKWAETFDSVRLATQGYDAVLATINPKILDSVKDFAALGASAEDLKNLFPVLTKTQIDAAVNGAKAANDLKKSWLDLDEAVAKSHGDSIIDWLSLEAKRRDMTIADMKEQGKATADALALEQAQYEQTIDAEIQKREELIPTSKAAYQKMRDEAKALLDLEYTDLQGFTDADRRLANDDFNEKERLLQHWWSDANDKIQSNAQKAHQAQAQQTQDTNATTAAVTKLVSEWDLVGGTVDKDTAKVKTLSGEVLTLKQYEAQQLAGGSNDVTSANLQDQATAFGLNYTNALKLAKLGYSFQEILSLLQGQGAGMPTQLPAPKGPKIPGFRDGGIGDFGEGTLAVLHGKEAIVPLNDATNLGGMTNIFYVNGTGEQVFSQFKQRLQQDLLMRRQFSAQ